MWILLTILGAIGYFGLLLMLLMAIKMFISATLSRVVGVGGVITTLLIYAAGLLRPTFDTVGILLLTAAPTLIGFLFPAE